jgi:outer membrane protein TolC
MSDIGVDITAIEKDRIKADLIMRFIDAYYGYLIAITALKSVNEALALMENHVTKAQSYYEANIMTNNDVPQAKVRLAQLTGQRLQMENSVILAGENLLVLLNEPPGTLLVPADEAETEIQDLKVKEMMEHEAIDIAMKIDPI